MILMKIIAMISPSFVGGVGGTQVPLFYITV